MGRVKNSGLIIFWKEGKFVKVSNIDLVKKKLLIEISYKNSRN